MSEIYETAGTRLLLLLPREDTKDQAAEVSSDSGLSLDDLKSMALAAAHQLLDRFLDAHQIELQEAMFSMASFEEDTYEAKLNRI
jgi:hypothetical protein